MVIPPDVFRQVERQSLPSDAALGRQPVDVAPLAIAEGLVVVVHQPVDLASGRNPSIADEGVRADHRACGDALAEQGQQRLGLHVGDHLGPHLPTPAQDAKDGLLGPTTASLRALGTLSPPPVAPRSPQIGFIDLHHAREDWGYVPHHSLAHQEQSPQNSFPLQALALGHLSSLEEGRALVRPSSAPALFQFLLFEHV
jgi:hypothetical protein